MADRDRLEKLRRLKALRMKAGAQPAAPEEQFSGLESAARGAAEGASLGFYDEIVGGVESLLTDKSYEQARDEARANQTAARKEDPWTFGGSELVGGFALPGFGAAKAAGGAAKLLPKAARAAGIGAGYGGAAGAGYSEGETVGDVLESAAGGAALGGALGSVLPVAGRGLQRARNRYKPGNRAAREVSDLLGDADEAKQFLRDNPQAVLGDTNPRTRAAFTEEMAKDPELMARMARQADDVRPNVMGAVERGPKPIDTSGYALIDESALPAGTLDKFRGRFQDNDMIIKALDDAEGLVVNSVPRTDPSFSGRVLQLAQSQMNPRLRSAGETPISQLGKTYVKAGQKQLTNAIDEVLPGFKAVSKDYAKEGDRLRKALKKARQVENAATGTSREKYLRDIADTPKHQTALRQAFGDETAEQLIEASKTYRIASERLKEAQKIGDRDLVGTLRSGADDLAKAFGKLTTANIASMAPGTNPVLARQAAVMDIARATAKLIPLTRTVTGRGKTEREIAKLLQQRSVPSYQPAAAQSLSRPGATAAGAVGIMSGRE